MNQQRIYKSFARRKYQESYGNSIQKKKSLELDNLKSEFKQSYFTKNQTPKHTTSITKWSKPDYHKISNLQTQQSRFGSKRTIQDSSSGSRYPQKSSIKKISARFCPDVKFQRQTQLQQVQQQYFSLRRPKPFYTKEEQKINNLRQNRDQYKLSKKEVIFQSARTQSIKCLQNLSQKVQKQIFNIDCKIKAFNTKMNRMIQGQFKQLKDKIIQVVNKVFLDSQKNIVKFMKIQQQILASDILQMKDILSKQMIKIEQMKQQLNRPNWRKIAGQLIANDTLEEIEQKIKQANLMQTGYWQMPALFDKKLVNFQLQVKQLVKITN